MHKKFLFTLLGIALLAVFFSSCRVIDASALPHNMEAHMGSSTFVDKEVTIEKGKSLDLVDDASGPHIIKNGTWDASGNQAPGKETGAPDIGTVNFVGNDRSTIGPFNTAGDFKIYCTIHPGMNLTIHVQ